MDIFAHGLWAGAAAIGANRKLRTPVRPLWVVLWGVFPDLFAFTVPLALVIWQRVADPPQAVAEAGRHSMPHLSLAWDLYQVSHSYVVFGAAFALVWFFRKRPVLEMLGWALHVTIDIPTHTTRFFPTPFLWPVASFHASGISWGNRWFMIANYSALAFAYLLLWITRRREPKA
jgi:hypothetical protein